MVCCRILVKADFQENYTTVCLDFIARKNLCSAAFNLVLCFANANFVEKLFQKMSNPRLQRAIISLQKLWSSAGSIQTLITSELLGFRPQFFVR